MPVLTDPARHVHSHEGRILLDGHTGRGDEIGRQLRAADVETGGKLLHRERIGVRTHKFVHHIVDIGDFRPQIDGVAGRTVFRDLAENHTGQRVPAAVFGVHRRIAAHIRLHRVPHFLRQPDHRHIRVFEEPDRFTDPGDLVGRIVEKVDDIAFVVPVDQLRAVKRIAVVQNHGGRVHLGGLQIVLEPKFPGDEEQELVVIVNMTERQTVGGRRHMKHGRAVVCEILGSGIGKYLPVNHGRLIIA